MKMYKVVTVKDGKRFGLYNFLGSSIRVEYFPDGRIIAAQVGCSLLYVCQTLEEAILWQRKDTEIWEVDATMVAPIVDGVLMPSDEEVILYWQGKREMVVNGKKVAIATDSRPFIGCLGLTMIKKVL